jgi:acetolactate synthase-1/2/3 large subunit/sulfoacetaldehyde acetyltransferase
MAEMTAGQAVVQSLRAEGCRYAFGIIGVSYLEIGDAFYDLPDLKFVSTRHEQGAAFMADGYARATGKAGVCTATGGPGVVNLVAGVYTAHRAYNPVIAICGAANQEVVYREAGQELDHVSIFRPITKLAVTVPKTERIPELMRHAFRVAMAGKQGPVFIDFPRDLMNKGPVDMEAHAPQAYRAHQRSAGDPALVQEAARLLKEAERPLVIAGGGVTHSDASAEVVMLAELLRSPVVASYQHNDAIPNDHPLFVGPYGTRGAPETAELAAKADVIIGIGTRLLGFNEALAAGRVSRDARIIQVEVDEKEIGRYCPADIGILGDARAVTQAIVMALRQEGAEGCSPTWTSLGESIKAARRQRLEGDAAIAKDAPNISPFRVYAEVRKAATPETAVVLDAGACSAYGYDRVEFQEPRTFLSPPSGGLGYAFPEALGFKLGRPDRPVVALQGDGGFLFNSQELETAVREKIGVVSIVMNNGVWGSEKALQLRAFGRNVGSDITNPRFDKLAELYGGKGYYVEHVDQLGDMLREALSINDRPSVIEVPVDPNDLPL